MKHMFRYILYSVGHLYVTQNHKERVIRLDHFPRSLLYKCYAFSSFHYTIVGVTFLCFPLRSDYYQSFYPYFLCVQGLFSYLSDVVYLERIRHWSQYLDRTFACYNMIVALFVIHHCFENSKYELAVVTLGIAVKKIDDYCFSHQHIRAYMVFHILWHSILPVFGIYKAIQADASPQ